MILRRLDESGIAQNHEDKVKWLVHKKNGTRSGKAAPGDSYRHGGISTAMAKKL